MKKCLICEVKLGFLNTPLFGRGKTKDGDRLCGACYGNLWRRNSPFAKTSKYATAELLEGIDHKKIKAIRDRIQANDPKLLKMPEVAELPYLLDDAEKVEKAARGYLDERTGPLEMGLIVVTDKRALALDVAENHTKIIMKDFSFDRIASLSLSRGAIQSTITIICKNNTITTINIGEGGDKIFRYLRQKTEIAKASSSKGASAQDRDAG